MEFVADRCQLSLLELGDLQSAPAFGGADQGRWCFGKTPLQTFLDSLPLAKEKLLQAA